MTAAAQQNQPDWFPYLHFGYLPPRELILPFEPPGKLVTLPTDLSRAASQAGDVLSRAVHAAITPGRTHYIPLSGGLDSRALLAAAIEAGAEIETLTFGMPGAMDYEYGSRVARAVGCRHQTLNLHDHLPDTSALVDAVRNGGQWTYTFDAYFNRLLTRQMGREPAVLHGFAGDPVAGAHYKPQVPDDGRAVKAFVDSQRYSRALSLHRPEDEAALWLPAIDAVPEIPGLTVYERLDFSVRQVGAIQPIVIDPAADVRTPFTHPEWLALMFSAPAEWRKDSRLYEAALLKRWPELFKLPTKNHHGLGLDKPEFGRKLHTLSRRVSGRVSRAFGRQSWLQRRGHNYIDFAHAYREPGILRELARENLADLEARGVVPWLVPTQLLADHIDGGKNYERELQLLIGLEINLKALSSGAL